MIAGPSSGQPRSMPRIDRCVKTVLDALYPIRCAICGQAEETGICANCLPGLQRIAKPCPRCGANFSGLGTCGSCQISNPQYDATLAPFRYAPPLSGMVHQLKYHRRVSLARPLATLLLHEIAPFTQVKPQLLIPVPLHLSRLIWRGFNQSIEIARYLSQALDIPIDRTLTYRKRRTQPQAALRAKYRRRNVTGCFGLRRPLHVKSVAIIDDVITSGETVNELARVLRKHGANLIQAWAPLHTEL